MELMKPLRPLYGFKARKGLAPLLSRRRSVLASAGHNAQPTSIHYVQAGESLTDIARQHGCSVRTIKELNYGHRAILKNDNVEPGKRLILPARTSHMVSVAAAQNLPSAALQPQVQGVLLLAGVSLLGFLTLAITRIVTKLTTGESAEQFVEVDRAYAHLEDVRQQTAAITSLLEDARKEMQEAESQLSLVQRVRDEMKARQRATVASNAVAFTPLNAASSAAATPEKVAVTSGVAEGGVITLPPPGDGSMAGVVDSLNRVWRRSQGGGGPDPPPPPPPSTPHGLREQPDSAIQPTTKADNSADVTAAAQPEGPAVALVSTEPLYGDSINSHNPLHPQQTAPAASTDQPVEATAVVEEPSPAPAAAPLAPQPPASAAAFTIAPDADTPPHITVDAFDIPTGIPAGAPVAETDTPFRAFSAAMGITSLVKSPPPGVVALTAREPEKPKAIVPFLSKQPAALDNTSATAAQKPLENAAASVVSVHTSVAEAQPAQEAPSPQPPTPQHPQGPTPPPNSKQQPPIRPTASPKYSEVVQSLKVTLMEGLYATGRGAHATSEQRAVAEEHISALECRNPNTRPVECLPALHGRWKLVYTSSPQTLLLLNALDSLPLVELGDVYQDIDVHAMTARNKIDIKVPVSMTLRADTSMQVKSARALKIQITRVGVDAFIRTPQLLTALEVPETLDFWGTALDLSPVKKYVVEPFNAVLETSRSLWNRGMSPDLEVQATESVTTWMLTTYLDETLRITRDASGNVFVLLRELASDPSHTEPQQPQ